eukprot:7343223-Prymnesium_polylepis.1
MRVAVLSVRRRRPVPAWVRRRQQNAFLALLPPALGPRRAGDRRLWWHRRAYRPAVCTCGLPPRACCEARGAAREGGQAVLRGGCDRCARRHGGRFGR